ncbi:MAG: copper-binding protein [Phenylobacterium sp.]|uniref:copper-binding protein n=1 Tax=Phenylobacterium sp. TaxID=1871053 RepID=UPI0011F82050|nr:copper-binding protein [Phenylobacterium sp.]TAL31254.1 MAG: copper-binding protein [Phenylobacterium sp.]
MKHLILTAAALGLAGTLAACGQKEAATVEAGAAPPAPAAAAPVASGSNMTGMAMPADAKMAKGTGTVTAVDATAGTITVDHAPIPEAEWPAMTMGFKATPALAQSVKVGDKVAFDLKLQGGAGEITAIQKQ